VPPPTPPDALTIVRQKLNRGGLPYMITGATAALWYGRDRITIDVDVVVDCTTIDPDAFARTFEPECLLDAELVRSPARLRGGLC
jgi:hypothetical protein